MTATTYDFSGAQGYVNSQLAAQALSRGFKKQGTASEKPILRTISKGIGNGARLGLVGTLKTAKGLVSLATGASKLAYQGARTIAEVAAMHQDARQYVALEEKAERMSAEHGVNIGPATVYDLHRMRGMAEGYNQAKKFYREAFGVEEDEEGPSRAERVRDIFGQFFGGDSEEHTTTTAEEAPITDAEFRIA